MSGVGYSVVVLGLVNQMYEFRLPATTTTDANAIHCYSYEFEEVDVRWQIQNIDGSQTAQRFRECLAKHGRPSTGHYAELQKEMTAAGLDPMRC